MGNNKSMMVILIAVMLVLVGVVVAAMVIIFNKINGIDSTAAAGGEFTPPPIVQTESLKQEEITPFALKDPLNVNLLKSADGSEHVIHLVVGLGVNNTDKKGSPALLTLIGESEIVVRDAVNVILRNKTIEELKQPDGTTALKEEIKAKLQAVFDTTLIEDVYIGDIYMN